MPPDQDDTSDPKVKDFIDAATEAQLARWFGLPSFAQLPDAAAEPAAPEDPEMAAVREQRARAIAAIDPVLVEEHRRRTDVPDRLIQFKPQLEVRVDPAMAFIDLDMIERQYRLAEPRAVEIPQELQDDLRDCTPQALLRDLHRPELDFDKTFEVVDHAAAQRLDIVAEVALAMATSWKLPPLQDSPFREAYALMIELRAERRQSWPALFAAQPLHNRRVVE
jgi:hypothetical protein